MSAASGPDRNEAAAVREVLLALSREMPEEKDRLGRLDAALGDGDHGISVAKTFTAVGERAEGMTGADPQELLRAATETILNTVGGAMGPLFGSAFLEAVRLAWAGPLCTGPVAARLLENSRDSVARRGRAEPGDKTMLDALVPAAEAAREAADGGAGPAEVFGAAAEAAKTGAEATAEMVARMGRASRLGERSVGHPDAGATSVGLMLGVVARTLARGEETG